MHHTYPEIEISVVIITSQDVAVGKVTYTRVTTCVQYEAWMTPENFQTNITGSTLDIAQEGKTEKRKSERVEVK